MRVGEGKERVERIEKDRRIIEEKERIGMSFRVSEGKKELKGWKS